MVAEINLVMFYHHQDKIKDNTNDSDQSNKAAAAAGYDQIPDTDLFLSSDSNWGQEGGNHQQSSVVGFVDDGLGVSRVRRLSSLQEYEQSRSANYSSSCGDDDTTGAFPHNR